MPARGTKAARHRTMNNYAWRSPGCDDTGDGILLLKKKPGVRPGWRVHPTLHSYSFFSSSYCLSLTAASRFGLVTPLPDPHSTHFGGFVLTGATRPQIR